MRIAITTRSCNDLLYSRMESFLPTQIPRIRYIGMNHWSDALTYLEKILALDYDYIVNVDEDCFITNWGYIENKIKSMSQTGITHFGMPDCKSSHAMRNNSPLVHNPFFNIFDVKKCFEITNNNVDTNPYDAQMDECFNDFFVKLYDAGKWSDMHVWTHNDGITTQNDFLMHTWYSRTYGNDNYHTERIDDIYEEAKQKWKWNNSL